MRRVTLRGSVRISNHFHPATFLGKGLHSKGFRLALILCVALGSSACVTVRPQQRAILADPLMRFDSNAKHEAELQHVLDNREGSFGGNAVQGGGCGCN
jgi:hypothetical protein